VFARTEIVFNKIFVEVSMQSHVYDISMSTDREISMAEILSVVFIDASSFHPSTAFDKVW
jgi:hypothetical protein